MREFMTSATVLQHQLVVRRLARLYILKVYLFMRFSQTHHIYPSGEP